MLSTVIILLGVFITIKNEMGVFERVVREKIIWPGCDKSVGNFLSACMHMTCLGLSVTTLEMVYPTKGRVLWVFLKDILSSTAGIQWQDLGGGH